MLKILFLADITEGNEQFMTLCKFAQVSYFVNYTQANTDTPLNNDYVHDI